MSDTYQSLTTQSSNSLDTTRITPEQQQRINSLLQSSKSKNTIEAYQSDWKHFTQFCNQNNFPFLPASPDTILVYISELAQTHKLSTIKRRLASINKAHVTSNHPSPTTVQTVKELLEGIARTYGSKQSPKKALVLDDLKHLIDSIDVSSLTGKRDKALILLGWSIASRRSELVSIEIGDVSFTSQGMDISIFEEKTQKHLTKSVVKTNNQYCPVESLCQWLEASKIKYCEIFRSINKHGDIGEKLDKQSVAKIIKKYCEKVGLDPSIYAGHSLRSGFITSAAHAGFTDAAIMAVSGHTSRNMIDRYTQEGRRYENSPTSMLNKL